MPALDADELSALRADVQALKQAALSPSSRISLSVTEFYKMVAAVVVAVGVAMFWLTTSLNSLKTEMNTKVDARFDALTARIDAQTARVDGRFDAQTVNINAIDVELVKELAKQTARLDALNTRLDRIETEVKRRP